MHLVRDAQTGKLVASENNGSTANAVASDLAYHTDRVMEIIAEVCPTCQAMRESDEGFYEQDILDYHDGKLTLENFSSREQGVIRDILERENNDM